MAKQLISLAIKDANHKIIWREIFQKKKKKKKQIKIYSLIRNKSMVKIKIL